MSYPNMQKLAEGRMTGLNRQLTRAEAVRMLEAMQRLQDEVGLLKKNEGRAVLEERTRASSELASLRLRNQELKMALGDATRLADKLRMQILDLQAEPKRAIAKGRRK